MATRFYIDRNGFSPSPSFTPTVQGSWGSDLSATYGLAPAGHSSLTTSTSLIRTVNTSSSAGTICHAICYSPPLSAVFDIVASDDVIATWRASEEFLTQNTFQQFYWGVCSNDGSIIHTISNLEKGATEFSTSLVSRTRTDADSGNTYDTIPGDRIFLEIGWDKDGAVAGDISIAYMYSTSAGDLVGDGDAGIQNPWFEYGFHTFTFDEEGTLYGATTPQRMMTGLGS